MSGSNGAVFAPAPARDLAAASRSAFSIALRSSAISFSSDRAWDLQPIEFAASRPDLPVDRADRAGALLLRRFQRRDALLTLLLERLEPELLGGDLFADEGEVLELVLDVADAVGARAAEVAVVRQHSTEAGRFFLVQQQLELLLAPVDVGGAQLAGELGPFGVDLALRPRLFALEFTQATFGRETLGLDVVKFAARLGDAEFGLAQFDGQLVALAHIRVDRLAHLLDAVVELAQLGFLLRRRLLLGRKHDAGRGEPDRDRHQHEQAQPGDPHFTSQGAGRHPSGRDDASLSERRHQTFESSGACCGSGRRKAAQV